MAQINNSFRSGGMSLAMSEAQFAQFFQFLKEKVATLPIVKAVSYDGEQSGEVWVLNRDVHIDKQEHPIQAEDRKFIWLEEAFPITGISLEQLIPTIKYPLNSRVLRM